MKGGHTNRDDADDRRTERRRVRYDPASDASPSQALVSAVADANGVDPLSLDPLHHTIDPDAIDAFVRTGGSPNVDGHITLQFEGREITVHACGLFDIAPPG